MKTAKLVLSMVLVICIWADGIAQHKKKSVFTKTTKVNTKVNTSLAKKCNPLDIRSTENILRDEIGRTLVLYMDRDNGYLEMMGKRQNLRFGEYKVNKPGNNWMYYMNDVKSEFSRVSYSNKMFYVTVHFETERNEIKGKCPGCRVGNDKRAPDINWKDPKIKISFIPVAHNGSFALEAVRVDILGKFDFNGVTDHFLPVASAYFKGQIAKVVKQQLMGILNQNKIKNTLANAFKPQVQQLKLGYIKSVDFSKKNIYLCNY
tara:strand:- start:6466 stop:7248 length:783 start_codon:yes stop_codon:yes gene_type:complete